MSKKKYTECGICGNKTVKHTIKGSKGKYECLNCGELTIYDICAYLICSNEATQIIKTTLYHHKKCVPHNLKVCQKCYDEHLILMGVQLPGASSKEGAKLADKKQILKDLRILYQIMPSGISSPTDEVLVKATLLDIQDANKYLLNLIKKLEG